MTTKQGRPRRFQLAPLGDPLGAELSFALGMLEEMALRVVDQVDHLPPEALNYTGPNSTLSVGRLVLHLAGADLTMLSAAVGFVPDPGWVARLDEGKLAGFSVPPGDLSRAPEELRAYLKYRRDHLLAACQAPGFLDRPVDHPYCTTARALLGHLVWHWSYHSGQIGLTAMEAGYDYVWTATKTS